MNEASSEQLEQSLRGHESLSEVEDFNGLTRKFIEHGDTIKTLRGDLEGKTKATEGMVKIPDDSSSDEDRKAFHTKRGRPETPEGYGYERPAPAEGQTYDDALEKGAIAILHKGGALKGDVKELLDYYNAHMKKQFEDSNAAIREAETKDNETLKKIWTGVTFDEKSAKSEQMFEAAVKKMNLPEGWTPETMKKEFEVLGFFGKSSPMLKYFMAEMFNLIGDDHFSDSDGGGGGGGENDRKHLEQMYPEMVKK